MKNKKTLIAIIAMVLVVAAMATLYFATRPTPNKEDSGITPTDVRSEEFDDSEEPEEFDDSEEPEEFDNSEDLDDLEDSKDSENSEVPISTADGDKTFTLTVVHSDSTKEFTITTYEDYLAPALISEGIINDEGIETGMYFTVDGETASWEENQSYWAIYVGDTYATEGLNTLLIEDGGVYKLEYTIG